MEEADSDTTLIKASANTNLLGFSELFKTSGFAQSDCSYLLNLKEFIPAMDNNTKRTEICVCKPNEELFRHLGSSWYYCRILLNRAGGAGGRLEPNQKKARK